MLTHITHSMNSNGLCLFGTKLTICKISIPSQSRASCIRTKLWVPPLCQAKITSNCIAIRVGNSLCLWTLSFLRSISVLLTPVLLLLCRFVLSSSSSTFFPLPLTLCLPVCPAVCPALLRCCPLCSEPRYLSIFTLTLKLKQFKFADLKK